jgi:hypothetical protein
MRSVSDNGATAPISALTYAFSIGSDRGLQTDDFGLRITALPACIEQESANLRQVVKRVRAVVAKIRAGIATRANRFRTFLDQGSATTNNFRHALTPQSNRLRAGFDDLSVEVIARERCRKHYAGLVCPNESPCAFKRVATWPCQAQGPDLRGRHRQATKSGAFVVPRSRFLGWDQGSLLRLHQPLGHPSQVLSGSGE